MSPYDALQEKNHSLVVGVGSHHGDDRLGWQVLHLLQQTIDKHAPIRFFFSDRNVYDWLWQLGSHTQACYFVDAVYGGGEPGLVHCLDLQQPVAQGLRPVSSHGFSLFDAIAMAQALDRLPATAKVYGIEAKQWQINAPMDAVILQAVPTCVALLRSELGV